MDQTASALRCGVGLGRLRPSRAAYAFTLVWLLFPALHGDAPPEPVKTNAPAASTATAPAPAAGGKTPTVPVTAAGSPAPAGKDRPAAPAAGSRSRESSRRARTSPRIVGGAGLSTNQAVHRLNFESIVRLVYEKNPSVRAAREEMEASRHGLDEFRSNLSRLEPYVEMRSDQSEFPNRRDAFGNRAESVVGVKKETFDGSVISTEVGGSYSRYEFGSVMAGQEPVESGGGALVRSRLEMPFFGSRRRQDRIIAQAFQESRARKAQLDYLKSYRTVAEAAVEYYNEAVYYQRLIDAYERYAAALDGLIANEKVKELDRARLDSVRGGAETTLNIYRTRFYEDLQIVKSYVALAPGEEITLDVPEYRLSPVAARADDPGVLHELLQQARQNNPAFAVLRDARANAELQRQRAIKGRYDVTAFLEGTTFPVGSESFDDRFEGWTVGGGLNVRLNDRRVLKHTQLKAESEIRQFEAEIEAEELLVRRRITTETQGLLENDRNRAQILDVIRQKTDEFQTRQEDYFAGRINIDQLIETRSGLAGIESSLASNLYTSANRESRLLLATGRVYELVGLKVANDDGDARREKAKTKKP